MQEDYFITKYLDSESVGWRGDCLWSMDCHPWTLDSGIPAGMTVFLARRNLCMTMSASAWERE